MNVPTSEDFHSLWKTVARLPVGGGFISRPMASPRSTLPTGFIEPCLPIRSPQPPVGSEWVHEIKHDGLRVIARKAAPKINCFILLIWVTSEQWCNSTRD